MNILAVNYKFARREHFPNISRCYEALQKLVFIDILKSTLYKRSGNVQVNKMPFRGNWYRPVKVAIRDTMMHNRRNYTLRGR